MNHYEFGVEFWQNLNGKDCFFRATFIAIGETIDDAWARTYEHNLQNDRWGICQISSNLIEDVHCVDFMEIE